VGHAAGKHNRSGAGESQAKRLDFNGMKACYDWFVEKGHDVSIVLPPRRRMLAQDGRKVGIGTLNVLERTSPDTVIYAPDRQVGTSGHRITGHDDHTIFDIEQYAMPGAIIVSNDFYRDHYDQAKRKNDHYLMDVIELQILPYTFRGGKFVPPREPLGIQYQKMKDGGIERDKNRHPKRKSKSGSNSSQPDPIQLEQFLRF